MKVPVMSTRLAIAIVAVFATGLILTPVETSARNGGFAGGHAIAFHGGFPARTVRPAFRSAFGPTFGRSHGVRHFRQRRFSGAGASWGAWGYAPSDLGYYEPPAVVTEEQPSEEPESCTATAASGMQHADLQGPLRKWRRGPRQSRALLTVPAGAICTMTGRLSQGKV